MAASRDPRDADVAVIGGGPAGAAAATVLARAGKTVVVLERERFPRFHIGESLLPRSRAVFERLGVADALAAAPFTDKRGATFVAEDGEPTMRSDFTAVLGDAGRAWHVERARFDRLLLEHARACGADVREGAGAANVAVDADGVTVATDDGATVRAAEVVDASGRRGVVAKALGLRRPDPQLRHVAAYGHFAGVAPAAAERAGDIRIVSRGDLAWLWFIPLGPDATSVGAVFAHGVHEGGAPEAALARFVAGTPVAARWMEGARPLGPARFEADFSYESVRYAGPRWLLAGDAGAFLDPVFSTGVHLALASGVEAADAILADTPGARRRYDRRVRRRHRFFRRYARGFYNPGFRDLLFRPDAAPAVHRAVTRVLAGDDRPGLRDRMLLRLFLLLSRVQRHAPLVPRLHGARAAAVPAFRRPAREC